MATYEHVTEDGRGNVISRVTRTTPPEYDNRETMRGKVQQAIAANVALAALPTPLTNAQRDSAIQALARQNNALIRLLLGLLDSAADT